MFITDIINLITFNQQCPNGLFFILARINYWGQNKAKSS
ncbi:hypothetical protein GPSY_0131 [Paraglaciecola psychrophila 170]|nr:hypothetical protein GPSY_0131 [Paraglaciecola psychrophila 170]